MTPVDVLWGEDVNRLRVLCDCGHTFWTRVDRYIVWCPFCEKRGDVVKARNELAGFKGDKDV